MIKGVINSLKYRESNIGGRPVIYLSKGVAGGSQAKDTVQVIRGGESFFLSGKEAEVWQAGRFQIASAASAGEKRAVQYLVKRGLAESEKRDGHEGKYWILTRCVCCAAEGTEDCFSLTTEEKEILFWLKCAGIRLTVAELVFLSAHQVKPEPKLLGEENSQALVDVIYTPETIGGQILEEQMASADSKERIVDSLLALLQKKMILIL